MKTKLRNKKGQFISADEAYENARSAEMKSTPSRRERQFKNSISR
jgi:hypothetical protein